MLVTNGILGREHAKNRLEEEAIPHVDSEAHGQPQAPVSGTLRENYKRKCELRRPSCESESRVAIDGDTAHQISAHTAAMVIMSSIEPSGDRGARLPSP